MAKRITTGKRDREKSKQAKRLEKQKRKDERISSKSTGSLDDMIAYVDENGMITSTPPDTTKKEVIELEDIIIATPKKEEEEKEPLQGKVDYYDSAKGFGFIKDNNNAEKYFFHMSQAPETIDQGDKVFFELERGMRGMNAVRISIIK